jgi:hypothetical protein
MEVSGLETIALGLTAASAVVGAGAQVYSGIQADKAAKKQALQLQTQGQAEFASAQRDALEARLQGKLLESRQMAAAAASGGGAGLDAPSIVKLMSETGDRTEYAAQAAMYAGVRKKQYYNDEAANARSAGRNNLIGSVLSSFGTLAGGFGDTVSMYGGFKKDGLIP